MSLNAALSQHSEKAVLFLLLVKLYSCPSVSELDPLLLL